MLSLKECDNASYELAYFDDLITEKLNPENFCYSCDDALFIEIQEQAKKEKYLVIKKITNTYFSFNDDNKIRCFINNLQSRICYLSNEVTRYIKDLTSDIDSMYRRLLLFIEELMVKLMDSLLQQFGNYFNNYHKIPNAYKSKVVHRFEKQIADIKNRTNDREHPLLTIALYPFIEIEKKGMCFYTFSYLDKLLEMLDVIDFSDSSYEKPLQSVLLFHNFNTTKFLIYMTENLQARLDMEDTNGQKLQLLLQFLKKYNQIEKTENPFKPKSESIWTQITSWIADEIEHLEKLKIAGLKSTDKNSGEHLKIESGLSVSQLALLTRLEIEEDIIIHKNQFDVLRSVASNYKTKNTDTISVESLRTRFYNVETSTKEAVKDRLIRMLNRINEHY